MVNSTHLHKISHILRPYDFCVFRVHQDLVIKDDVSITKFLCNTFSELPSLSVVRDDVGRFTIGIDQSTIDALRFNGSEMYVNAEFEYSLAFINGYVTSTFEDQTHSTIKLVTINLNFAAFEDYAGDLVVYIYRINNENLE